MGAEVLDAIHNHLGLSDRMIGDLCGMSRNQVNDRRNGISAITLADAFRFSTGLRIPIDLFTSDRETVTQWMLEHPEELPFRHRVRGRAEKRWTLPALATPSLALAS